MMRTVPFGAGGAIPRPLFLRGERRGEGVRRGRPDQRAAQVRSRANTPEIYTGSGVTGDARRGRPVMRRRAAVFGVLVESDEGAPRAEIVSTGGVVAAQGGARLDEAAEGWARMGQFVQAVPLGGVTGAEAALADVVAMQARGTRRGPEHGRDAGPVAARPDRFVQAVTVSTARRPRGRPLRVAQERCAACISRRERPRSP